MPKFNRLLKKNLEWVNSKVKQDDHYFIKLAQDQHPDFLWIGCSDSRIRVNHISGTHAGEVFVHRNIANQVYLTDFNLLSAVQYAVEVLKVDHVIICGHYNCGGIKAALNNSASGYINNWVESIRIIYNQNKHILDQIEDSDEKADKLSELNVLAQAEKLASTDILKDNWQKRSFKLHSVIYDMYKGYLIELQQQIGSQITTTKQRFDKFSIQRNH